jgi:hypothetical protein
MMLLKSATISQSHHMEDSLSPTDVVFAIFRFAQFVNEELNRVCGRANEAEATQVAHLFSILIFHATKKHVSMVVPSWEEGIFTRSDIHHDSAGRTG